MKNNYVLLLLFGFYFSHAMEQQLVQPVCLLEKMVKRKILSEHWDYDSLPDTMRNQLDKKQKKLNRQLSHHVRDYGFISTKAIGLNKIKCLLTRGADPNTKYDCFENQLEGAIHRAHVDLPLIESLINYGAIVTPKCFMLAVHSHPCSLDIFQKLQQAAPHIDWKQCEEKNCMLIPHRDGQQCTSRCYNWWNSIFHGCARDNDIALCRFLLPQASLRQLHMTKTIELKYRGVPAWGPYGFEYVGEQKRKDTVIELLRKREPEFQQLADALEARDLYSYTPTSVSVCVSEIPRNPVDMLRALHDLNFQCRPV